MQGHPQRDLRRPPIADPRRRSDQNVDKMTPTPFNRSYRETERVTLRHLPSFFRHLSYHLLKDTNDGFRPLSVTLSLTLSDNGGSLV